MARRDGRSANQLRPPQVELRPLQRADGSARFRFGDCTVSPAERLRGEVRLFGRGLGGCGGRCFWWDSDG